MSDIRKYVQLLESSYNQVNVEQSYDECYLFSYDAEKLYESSGISLDVLMENRINWLRDNIMHKLEPLADKEGKTTEELFNWIIDRDPSTKKQYSQWLMKILVGKNAQSSLGDLEEAKQTLTKYEELKKSKALKPEHKDLNQFKSIDELSKAISDTEQNIKAEYDAIEQRARNESKIIHEDDTWIVVIPKTEYAAGYWGKETLWCTAAGFEGGRQEDRDHNMFNRYSNKGNLYIIKNKKKSGNLYQIQLDSKQFMDSEDDKIEKPEDRKKIIDHFPTLKDAIYGEIKDSDDSYDLFLRYVWIMGDVKNDKIGSYIEDMIANNAKKSYRYAAITRSRFEKGEDAISKDLVYSYKYASDIIDGRFEKGEDTIAKDAEFSYDYAKFVIKDRFEKGESIISKNAKLSYQYARDVIKGRFEKGEDTIISDPYYLYEYITDVIKGRFEEGEDTISKNLKLSYDYARKVLKGRFEKGEDIIAKSAGYSYDYAKNVIGGRFEKGEDAIAKSAGYSYDYAKDIIKDRFEKGEEEISKDIYYSYDYAKNVIGGRFEKGEDAAIAKDAFSSIKYAIYIIKGRFEKGEDAISTDIDHSYDYASDVIKGRFEKGEDIISTDVNYSYNYAMKVLKGRFKKGEDIMSRELGRERKDKYYQLTGIRL